MMRKFAMKVLSMINKVIPKKNRIIFGSFPDISGNALAVYNYILDERPDIQEKYELVWSASGDKTCAEDLLINKTGGNKSSVVKRSSVLGIYSFMRSKYIVSTHGFYPEIGTSKNQVHINLWHGMPFKKIGLAVEEHTGGREDKADITIATSETFRKIMADAFGITEDKVFVTGQPCNDALLRNCKALENFGVAKSNFTHVIMWMPTYRKSVVGDIRQDGNVNSFGVVEVIRDHFEELDSLLRRKNYLLVIKPHPMDEICKMAFPTSKNIVALKNEDLSEKNIELYELLSECDVLLTDYSSVFVDYLITGNPIAFVCDDMDSYADSRGFFFDPPRDYMPGELIRNYSELRYYLSDMDSINDK